METIAVLGLGLIGGSLALALREANLAEHIAGYDADLETTRRARERGVITHGYATAEEAAGQADLVILAIPIHAIPALLERIAPALKPGALVTDTASTKVQVVQRATALLPQHVVFVGGHPMAGRELSGIEAAQRGLFAGCTYCLTPTAQTPPEAMAHCLTKIFLSPLRADIFPRLCSGLSPKTATSLICSEAGEELGIRERERGRFLVRQCAVLFPSIDLSVMGVVVGAATSTAYAAAASRESAAAGTGLLVPRLLVHAAQALGLLPRWSRPAL